ncbi:MAG: nucleotidyltransferase domain-containing protein [Clostridia bacterium]|nr:nucleotidyltransferase domain-containing protein [Clostridia bacterium]
METKDFYALLQTEAYDFLRENERFGKRIMLLGLSGSYGYGTNREGSDVDFRGVTLQLPSDLLGLTEFEQYVDGGTDTVIYGFNKLVRLLLECNPNSCEILGLPREKYLIISPLGEELLANQRLFLSKRAIKAFGGYASAQLRRLQNAIARDALPQADREKHILQSVQNAMDDFNRRNARVGQGSIRLFIDRAVTEGMETEIFVDADYRHLPLRDYNSVLETLRNVVRDYDRIGKRNHKKDDNHLNKHAMHLIRLMMTVLDILEKQEIIICRQENLPLLMKIRNGGYILPDGTLSKEFYEVLDFYERRVQEAAKITALPDEPDMAKVGAFVEAVNRRALKEED